MRKFNKVSFFDYFMGKRGLTMVVTMIIMIVLSIAVLTVLMIFLNSQTGFFSRWIGGQTTKSNVDAVIDACDSLVITQSVYAYCCETKEVIFGGDKANENLRCVDIAGEDWSRGEVGGMDCSADIC